MWVYESSTGRLYHADKLVAVGYAGRLSGLNNVAMQYAHDVGPLPAGRYYMDDPIDTATHGPYVIWLTPDTKNIMGGRSDFAVHGDRKSGPPFQASHGCIIMGRDVREAMWESHDHTLDVIGKIDTRPASPPLGTLVPAPSIK